MERDLFDCSEHPDDLFVLARIPKKNVAIVCLIIRLAAQPPKHLHPPRFCVALSPDFVRWDVTRAARSANSNPSNVKRVFKGEQDRFVCGVWMGSTSFCARDRESSLR